MRPLSEVRKMEDLKAILDYYVRRNIRLKERGIQPESARTYAVVKGFREDKIKIPKNPAEAKTRSQESSAAEATEEAESAARLKELVDAGKAEWKTLNGVHVCIMNGTSEIVGGPKHLVGKNANDFGQKGKSVHDVEIPKVTKSPEELKTERANRAKMTARQIAEAQKNLTISETGANPSCGGFIETDDKPKLSEHHDYHGKEPAFEKMSKDEYDKFAEEFLKQPCSDTVLGGIIPETYGDVVIQALVRYDKNSGIFAKGYPGGYIKTCMIAKYTIETPNGKVVNPNWKRDGYDYFLREMAKAKKNGSKEETA